MDAALSWLDDELTALNNAEEAMGKTTIEYAPASSGKLKNGNTPFSETDNSDVTHSTSLPKSQTSSAHTKHIRNKKDSNKVVEEEVETRPEKISESDKDIAPPKAFPTLDYGLDQTILPSVDTDMAQRFTSMPLVSEDSSNKEDELEFFTKSLIDKMNSPPDADMYGYCAKCNQSVEGEKTGCNAMNEVFHIDCFRCKTCEKLLHGIEFYVVDKQTFCEPCYMNSLEKCTVCSEVITDRILRATGKPYHAACFKCVVCSKNLDGVPFTVDVTNQIHCVDCFHKKFAPKCSVCDDPIMPENGQEETVRIVALDRSFHIDCYRCEKCEVALSSKGGEGKGCFPLDGRILCRDCNTALVQEMSHNIR